MAIGANALSGSPFLTLNVLDTMVAPIRRDFSQPVNLVDLLRQRAVQQGDKVLYRVLQDEGGADEITFTDLFLKATRVATRLQAQTKPGDRALLLTTTSLDTIVGLFGCICAGVYPAPIPMPRAFHPCSRLQSVIRDATPALVISSAATLASSAQRFAKNPELLALPWLAVDEAAQTDEGDWRDPRVSADAIAFLQYTSGSTASPKGVMVTHGNVMANSNLIRERVHTSDEMRMCSWLPLFHDMGLIGVIMQSLWVGGSATLLSPASFMLRPLRWLMEISANRSNISGGPDFAYELCVRKSTPAERQQLDLSCWRSAFSGAETVRAETIDRFSEAFAPAGFRRDTFYPCYGLAESTLMATGRIWDAPVEFGSFKASGLEQGRAEPAEADSDECATLVSNGLTTEDHRVAIVDPATLAECAPGVIGEIWLSGPSIAAGYWNKPELTKETFDARIVGGPDRSFLRTGDLGFQSEGRLFIVGRLKDLIIIQGRNYYPADIETTVVHSHPAFRPGGTAAFSIKDSQRDKLVIVQEVDRTFPRGDADDVVVAVRQAVAAEHEVEVSAIVLLKPTTLPRTTSGKVQRGRCRDAFLADELEVLTRWDLVETDEPAYAAVHEGPATADAIRAWLVANVAQRLKVPAERLETDQPFSALGLVSKDVVALIGRLQEWLGQPLSPAVVFNYPTIDALAEHLAPADESATADGFDSDASAIDSLSERELEELVTREISRLH
jgi:acyl-CoA synthetase (AMP-forming)/AMP-acid ligase II/acyl carrier protein